MKFLRSLGGYRLINQKCNTNICAELNNTTLAINKTQETDWYEHILRMKESQLPHAVLQYKPTGV
jgi:hypothetical protein